MSDEAISLWLHGNAHPVLTRLLLVVTHAHNTAGLATGGVAMAAVLWRRKAWDWLRLLVVVLPGVIALNSVLKLVFQRERPVFEQPMVTLDTYSFPSGHAAGTAVLYLFIAAWLLTRLQGRGARTAVVVGAAAMVVIVAFSRVYLGAHYPSDVLAGLAEGIVWFTACRWALLRKRPVPP